MEETHTFLNWHWKSLLGTFLNFPEKYTVFSEKPPVIQNLRSFFLEILTKKIKQLSTPLSLRSSWALAPMHALLNSLLKLTFCFPKGWLWGYIWVFRGVVLMVQKSVEPLKVDRSDPMIWFGFSNNRRSVFFDFWIMYQELSPQGQGVVGNLSPDETQLFLLVGYVLNLYVMAIFLGCAGFPPFTLWGAAAAAHLCTMRWSKYHEIQPWQSLKKSAIFSCPTLQVIFEWSKRGLDLSFQLPFPLKTSNPPLFSRNLDIFRKASPSTLIQMAYCRSCPL